MGRKIVLLLGMHNHQPTGNFDHIFEKAYQDAYAPFLKLLLEFPGIKINLHYSGCLLEWIEANHPEFLCLIAALVKRGQASLLSGGFYEPILPIIPSQDARDQMIGLNNYLKDKFDFTPRGFWLTERVWEPGIPEIVSATGLEYTIVDDTHFVAAGLKREEIHGVFVTEDRGNILKIFPIDKTLRYIIPFRLPEETIRYLKEARDRGVEAVTLADDGEKFGLWPGTKKWVYEEKWLLKFFTILQESDFIETLTFEEYLGRKETLRRVYLPAASYDEMMEWSGGFFRNFLVKYPEANNLYSKMLYVSGKVHRAAGRTAGKDMKRNLWKGQCSCPYWHGVFGGLYLPYLREANYTSLLKAEAEASIALKEDMPRLIKADFDHDGKDEILAETRDVNVYFKPNSGAGIFELDYKPAAVNMQDVLTRREEPYHQKIIAERNSGDSSHVSIHEIKKKADFNPKEFLAYDGYQRNSFLLRLMSSFNPSPQKSPEISASRREPRPAYPQRGLGRGDSTENAVRDGKMGEAWELLTGQYSARTENRRGEITVVFEKTASFGSSIFSVSKKVHINKKGGEIGYEVELVLAKGEWQGYLGLEFCMAVLKTEINRKREGIVIKDCYRNMEVEFTAIPEASWWTGPLQTVSQSEKGYELISQATIVFPYWKADLGRDRRFNLSLREEIRKL